MSKLLSVSEVCKRYKVTRKTLYNWNSQNKIELVKKSGRTFISTAEIEVLAEKRSDSELTQSNSELHKEIRLLSNRIERLESVITQLLQRNSSKVTKTTQPNAQEKTDEQSSRAYDAKRTEDLIEKCRSVFTQLDPVVQTTITKKDFAKLAGVSRGSVTKHWDKIVTK